jgi:cytochrome c biogenesis protein CcmG/thiol:disulfide interchange protein DsbE
VLLAGAAVVIPMLALLAANLGRDPHSLDTPLIGRTAPTFALREVGETESFGLERYRGKPIVLNFWATWCVPCHAEHPVLQAGAESAGTDVQFLGVVFDDQEPIVQDFLKTNGSRYPTLIDDAGKTAIAYGVTGVPETFFIDRTGKIVDKFKGPLSADELRKRLLLVTR